MLYYRNLQPQKRLPVLPFWGFYWNFHHKPTTHTTLLKFFYALKPSAPTDYVYYPFSRCIITQLNNTKRLHVPPFKIFLPAETFSTDYLYYLFSICTVTQITNTNRLPFLMATFSRCYSYHIAILAKLLKPSAQKSTSSHGLFPSSALETCGCIFCAVCTFSF